MAKKDTKKPIEPEDIKFSAIEDEIDDADMPRPETKEYKKFLKTTPKFINLFYKCVNDLPYNSVLTHPGGHEQKLIEIVHFVEQRLEKFPVDEMNALIGFISNLPFKHARPLMEVIESKEGQPTLWSMYEA